MFAKIGKTGERGNNIAEKMMRLPSPRECKEAILPLTGIFLNFANEVVGKRVKGFDTKVKKQLSADVWDGSVREQKRAGAHGATHGYGERSTPQYFAESTRVLCGKYKSALRKAFARAPRRESLKRGRPVTAPGNTHPPSLTDYRLTTVVNIEAKRQNSIFPAAHPTARCEQSAFASSPYPRLRRNEKPAPARPTSLPCGRHKKTP